MRLVSVVGFLLVLQCSWGFSVDEILQQLNIGNHISEREFEKIEDVPMEKISTTHLATLEDYGGNIAQINEVQGVAEYLFQGDIMLTEEQLEALEREQSANNTGRSKRQASTVYSKWTNGNVYYYLDNTISSRKARAIAAAIDYVQSRTCINFYQSSSAQNRIRVTNGKGCSSFIGMNGGEQKLSIGDGCTVIGTIAHEFSHALGLHHMQSRHDRDDYVTVDTSTVDKDARNNFVKTSNYETTNYTPYEYGSFMHYSANAFAGRTGAYTIVPIDTDYTYTMGNRLISFYDMQILNEHYGCNAKCNAARSARCENGGLPNPRNCNVCNCPLGYGGKFCDQRPSGCGEQLTATQNWQSNRLSFGDSSSEEVRDGFTTCHHWISAPKGKTIQVKITSMSNTQCQFACPFNGIEIKTRADKRITNPRICCPEFQNTVYESHLNPTPIIYYNRYASTVITIEYRYVDSNPGVLTTSVAPTTRPDTSGCRDQLSQSDCAYLVSIGFCTNKRFSAETIKSRCAKSCNMCQKTVTPTTTPSSANCRNGRSDDECGRLAAWGFCTNGQYDTNVIKSNCAKTCGLCNALAPSGPTTASIRATSECKNMMNDALCERQAKQGFCTNTQWNDIDSIKYHCAKSCNLCGVVKSPCRDKSIKCSVFKSFGKCVSLDKFLAEYHCAATCGFCQNPA